jgi:hypothetical protein
MINTLGSRVRRPLALVIAVLSLALVLANPGSAEAAVRTPSHHVASTAQGSMTSYVHGTASHHRRVVGRFVPHQFKVTNGHMVAVGTLNVVTRGPGKDRHLVKHGVAIPVHKAAVTQQRYFASGAKSMPAAAALGSCPILNLVLGPLDLDLLGLQVHLDKVVLNIVAQSGAGNLLGNLLCAVAGLLDQAGILTQLTDLLNQILGILKL